MDKMSKQDSNANGGQEKMPGSVMNTPSMSKKAVKPSHGSMSQVPVHFDDAD